MTAFGIAIGAVSLICFALMMTRGKNRGRRSRGDNSVDGVNYAADGWTPPTGLATIIPEQIARPIRSIPVEATAEEVATAGVVTAEVPAIDGDARGKRRTLLIWLKGVCLDSFQSRSGNFRRQFGITSKDLFSFCFPKPT
jgi:hypothetical protein